MLLFRPAQAADLDAIYHLAILGGIGLTTLPADKKVLASKIEHSLRAFTKQIQVPMDENYFFVLEDLEHSRVVGTSAIDAAVGYHLPFYSYRVSKATSICHSLEIRNDYQFLNLVNDYQGKTEICSLFLEPSYRKHHNGALLSRSRFLFMAQFPQRFANVVFADMRGVSDEKGCSPFWESLGRHFFLMDFKQADVLTITTNKQFIADLMPRKPIYTSLLTPAAQQVIGKPHDSTLPAFKILLREGFVYRNYVDIFDAGPTLEASLEEITTLKQSKSLVVKEIYTNNFTSPQYIIGNTQLQYRATLGSVNEMDGDSCGIAKEVAEVLGVNIGSRVRVGLLHASI